METSHDESNNFTEDVLWRNIDIGELTFTDNVLQVE